ncbi:hypothetical protein ED733_004185 [Metarhizium rileyi]|uniref:DNA endonuclease activator Ctp1 C-terminal domain-containing protein n=1 Tax=Metarhizium rileyi (strain RCEF 4871) TaxID=1649241 RepID=A0A5C6G928_METRR|nr:hypothetical protein ED733_004185 [Metarhizium rileyi]
MATAWFEKGRPALFTALSSVCDQIEKDLTAEIQSRNLGDTHATISREPEDECAKVSNVISCLEAENEELRKQLVTLRSSHMTSLSPTTSTAEIQDQVPEIGHSSSNISTPSGLPTTKSALQRRKDERDSWVQHAKFLQDKIQAAEDKYSIQILGQGAHQIEVPTTTALDADEPILNPSLSFMTDGGSEEAEPQLPELVPELTNTAPAGQHTYSETTQGEASDEIAQPLPALLPSVGDKTAVVKQEQFSDIPEIVSEREVRKRRRNEKHDETTVMHEIKAESARSPSPVMLASPVHVHTQESIDLDDIVKKIQTPRKRQLLEPKGPQSEIVRHRHSKSVALTPVHPIAQQQPQSAILPRQSSALMPLSVNARGSRPVAVPFERNGRWRQLRESKGSLAEDGADYETQQPTDRVKWLSACSSKTRLDALLNDCIAYTEDENISSRLQKRPELRSPVRDKDLGIPGRRQLPFDMSGLASSKTTQVQPVPTENEQEAQDSKSASPQRTISRSDLRPLRQKPSSELCLEDFKVNPHANEGHDFAFTDVVRNRGDRACLPGCADLHCCGKEFRAIAISQRPNPPLTASQRQEEQKLLEDYLGGFSYRLASMDKNERMEVWIEAKTQELANKYGKHRHRFSRMQSPPGFWDADFPDTQQLEADKEEAEKRKRRAVAERYREARRPGGRWVFKDEC